MNPQYQIWIAQYVKSQPFILGICSRATEEMVKAFPELKRVPGHVETANGRFAHWWCVDPEGKVVDPTAAQYRDIGGILAYDPWRPGSLTRVGKCMDCGDEIWKAVDSLDGKKESFCSKRCEARYIQYLETGR